MRTSFPLLHTTLALHPGGVGCDKGKTHLFLTLAASQKVYDHFKGCRESNGEGGVVARRERRVRERE